MNRVLRLALWALLGAAACGDADESAAKGVKSMDAQPAEKHKDASPAPEKDASAADAPASTSAVAVLTRTCGPDDCLSYLNVYDSVDAIKKAGRVDKSKSIELPYSQGRTHDGSIYLFSRGEQAEVTRWSVADDLTPREEEKVSFANTGTLVFCEICNVFASNELAYHFDATGQVVVAWNPKTMEILKRTMVPEDVVKRKDTLVGDILWPRVYNNRAFYTAAWSDFDKPEVWDRTTVLTFDATSTAPEVKTIDDDRCGGSWAMAPYADSQGNVYMMGEWFSGRFQVGVLDPQTKPACLLRIKPDADEFDPDYYVDLLKVLDAQAVRGAFAMADDHLLLQILPKSAPKLTKEEIMNEPEIYYSVDDFTYTVLNLQTMDVTPVTSLPPAAGRSATSLNIDNRTFVQRYEDDAATLYEVHTDGSTEKILEAGSAGDFDMIGRVR